MAMGTDVKNVWKKNFLQHILLENEDECVGHVELTKSYKLLKDLRYCVRYSLC